MRAQTELGLKDDWNACALFEGDVVVQRLVALEDIDRCRDITRIIRAEGSTIVDVAFVVHASVKRSSVAEVYSNYSVVLHLDIQPVPGSSVCTGIHVLNNGAVPPVVDGVSIDGTSRSGGNYGMGTTRCE